ncbi:MAG: asparaginase [Granulosicoccus sp.]|nr:asparaginase [Granulosicoccus sp.]
MNPVLVNRWRGNAIESRHRGAVAVLNADGTLVAQLGDAQRAVFPRSAIKFLQAISFVESGAMQAFGLDDRHLALACASHNGEPVHVDLAAEWLERIGCDQEELECGATLPSHKATQFELLSEGRGPQRIHHNCSGKHLGLMSTCKHLGEQVRNYRLYNHSAQQRWFDVLESLSNARVRQLPWGYDGCAIPTLAMPLQRLALAMARFGDPSRFPDGQRQAVEQIHLALQSQPYLVAGKERLCTALMERLAPEIMVKVGAEGVYTAVIPEHRLGVALKIDDGHDGAARVALGAILTILGVLPEEDAKALEDYFVPTINNSRGETIGRMEPSSDWESIAPA